MKSVPIQHVRDIGALVRRRRKIMQLDQAELAERIGVSRAWIIKIEKGHPNAQAGLLFQLFNYMDISIEAQFSTTFGSQFKKSDILDRIREQTSHRRRIIE